MQAAAPAAHHARDGTSGALIEIFYGYPGQLRADRLAHGADVLQGAGLMDGSGQPHFLAVNLRFCEEIGIEGARDWWGQVIAFDALTGNTDRHSQNWGLLVSPGGQRRLAPMFDNGTSLGYQMLDAAVVAPVPIAVIETYIRKGRHSCRWAEDEPMVYDHIGLCRRFAEHQPAAVPAMRAAVAVTDATVQGFLQACTGIHVEPRFTHGRAEMVGALVRRRRDLLMEMLDQHG